MREYFNSVAQPLKDTVGILEKSGITAVINSPAREINNSRKSLEKALGSAVFKYTNNPMKTEVDICPFIQ